MKPGDKVRLTKKDPGDPTFHRRTLTVTRNREGKAVWCEWRERVEGSLQTLGNWFDPKDLVQAPVRKSKRRS